MYHTIFFGGSMIHFVDVETTGLDPRKHEIIEICIMTQYPNGKTKTFYTKIKPSNIEDADPRALAINGFDMEVWKGANLFANVAPMIIDNLQGGVIVGHNVAFDIAFIREELERAGVKVPRLRGIDTVTLAHEHLAPLGLTSLSLDSIRKFLGWTTKNAHTANKDTNDTRMLYNLLLRCKWYTRITILLKHKIGLLLAKCKGVI